MFIFLLISSCQKEPNLKPEYLSGKASQNLIAKRFSEILPYIDFKPPTSYKSYFSQEVLLSEIIEMNDWSLLSNSVIDNVNAINKELKNSPNLVVFFPETDHHSLEEYKSGKIHQIGILPDYNDESEILEIPGINLNKQQDVLIDATYEPEVLTILIKTSEVYVTLPERLQIEPYAKFNFNETNVINRFPKDQVVRLDHNITHNERSDSDKKTRIQTRATSRDQVNGHEHLEEFYIKKCKSIGGVLPWFDSPIFKVTVVFGRSSGSIDHLSKIYESSRKDACKRTVWIHKPWFIWDEATWSDKVKWVFVELDGGNNITLPIPFPSFNIGSQSFKGGTIPISIKGDDDELGEALVYYNDPINSESLWGPIYYDTGLLKFNVNER